MKVNIIIPARYGSTRLEGKPLMKIAGKEMIKRVVEQIRPSSPDYRVYVATDDERIKESLKEYDYCRVLLSGFPFKNGTERVYWAFKNIEKADIIINLQGDEPLISLDIIEMLAEETYKSSSGFATLSTEIKDPEEISSTNIVKVVTSGDNYALYFSRSPIPYNRDDMEDVIYRKHIGIYGFKARSLEMFNSWEESSLERAEKLEQLRILENGERISVINIKKRLIGVDTIEDIKKVEDYLNSI